MKADVSRVEEKYVLTKLQAEILFNKLKKILPGDSFNGNEPYLVRSLYFDSYYNDDYFDKLDGTELRKKIRIRIYSPDSKTAKLEVKQKQAANQRKQSITITREKAIKLINGDINFLLEENDSLAESIYYIFKKELYKPKCIVEYRRRAFQVPVNDIRITFDSDIETNEGNFDLFSSSLALTAPVDRKNTVVLEVKYNNFLLSYIKDALACVDAPMESYSKYVKGRYIGLY